MNLKHLYQPPFPSCALQHSLRSILGYWFGGCPGEEQIDEVKRQHREGLYSRYV